MHPSYFHCNEGDSYFQPTPYFKHVGDGCEARELSFSDSKLEPESQEAGFQEIKFSFDAPDPQPGNSMDLPEVKLTHCDETEFNSCFNEFE